MGRKAQGMGSVYQDKVRGRWVGAITIGYGDTGSQKRMRVYGKTKREVELRLAELNVQRSKGLRLTTEKYTVKQFFDRWLEYKTDLRPTTLTAYREAFDRLDPHLGNLQLGKLNGMIIQDAYSKMRQEFSSRTVQLSHTILHQALEQAERWGLIPYNPASRVDRPKGSDFKAAPWTAEEAQQFLGAIREHPYYPLLYVALHTGMRRGELLGLRWQDVDLTNRIVYVNNSRIHVQRGIIEGSPKTERSARAVPISQATTALLQQYRQHIAAEAKRLGWASSEYVFVTRGGKPIHPSGISHSFERLQAVANVRRIRFHDLRHTAASLMRKSGVQVEVVSKRLGHASTAFTLDYYRMVYRDEELAAVDALDQILPSPQRPQ